ncbi:cadherin-like beta sandwich domain-containing protein, partial [Candidatus Synechococcus spongiarum]
MATVENTVKYVKLIPTVNDPDATVKVGKGSSLTTVTSGSASSAIALDVGPNAITVEVTAEDGATTTYTVTVTRTSMEPTLKGWLGLESSFTEDNPTNLGVTSDDQRLNLTWTANARILIHTNQRIGHAVQYRRKDDTSWTTSTYSLGPTATNYSITGLENGTLYDVRIFIFLSISNSETVLHHGSNFVTGRGTPLAPTTDARLSALTASSSPGASRPFTPLTLSPAFASYTTSYTATVANTVTHVKITPTVRDSVATVKVGKGESLTKVSSGAASEAIALDVGTNAVTVEVTAQDGTTMKTYTVTVTRQSTDATLSDLTASSSPGASESFTSLTLSPDFASDTDSYTATVVNTMTHVKITPTANNSAAMVKVGKGESLTKVSSGTASEAIALRVGENAITVEVTAEDGTTKKTYTVTVTRQRSTDATLSGLTARARSITIKTRSDKRPFTLLPLSPDFAADTDSYTAMVASTVTNVKITPTVNNSAAMVKVGKKGESLTTVSSGTASEAIALRVGENAVTVEVTAEDEATKKTYTVTVTRGSTDPTVGVLLDTQLNRYNPTNLNIMADDQRLNLTWINPSNTNGLDHWILYKRQDDTIWTTGGSISSSFGETATSYSITGLESGTVYEVRVVVLAFTGTSLSTGNLRRGNFVTGSGTTLAPKPGSGTEGGFTPMTLGTPVTFASGLTPDLEPSFGSTSVPDQSYTEGVEITPLVLPAATGGNGPLTYALTPSLPDGLTLDLATRRLSGTPTTPQDGRQYTWTATDADGDVAELTFTIAIAVDPHRQRVREASRRALAEMARRSMSGALDTIGARFGAVGGSGLSLAGQPVSLESV